MFDVNINSKEDFRNFMIFFGLIFLTIVFIVFYVTNTSQQEDTTSVNLIPEGYTQVEEPDGTKRIIVTRDNLLKSDREIRNELGLDPDVQIERPSTLNDRPALDFITPSPPPEESIFGD